MIIFSGHFYGTPRPDDVDDNSSGVIHDDLRDEPSLILDPLDNMVNNTMTILPEQIDDISGPLPPNWEVAYSEIGEKYFIE